MADEYPAHFLLLNQSFSKINHFQLPINPVLDKVKDASSQIGIDELLKILDTLSRAGASYSDVRFEEYAGMEIQMKDGEVEDAVPGIEQGACVRALYNGAWGFFSSNDLSKLQDGAGRAFKMAKVSAARAKEKVKLAPVAAENARVIWKAKKNPLDVSIEEKVALLSSMDKAIRAFPEIKSAKIGYGDARTRTLFVSTDGARIETEMHALLAKASFTARRGSEIEAGRLRIGGTMGFEIFDNESPVEKCSKTAKSTINLLDAQHALGGRFPVICDHELTGVFTHEAVGHCCESDIVLAGESVLAGKIGKKVAAPLITIVDDPTISGAFGSFPYDDEGVKARRKVLIENGVLRSFILNREDAHKLKMEPNGGARAESFAARPIVRMSNTFIAGGASGRKFDELLEGIKRGIYAKGTRGGQVDTVKGSFQFAAQEAYLIENGEITRPLKGVSLSGMTLETLNNIDAIGNDFKLGDPGICGKGQMVFVSDGGPHIRIKNCVVGGMRSE